MTPPSAATPSASDPRYFGRRETIDFADTGVIARVASYRPSLRWSNGPDLVGRSPWERGPGHRTYGTGPIEHPGQLAYPAAYVAAAVGAVSILLRARRAGSAVREPGHLAMG